MNKPRERPFLRRRHSGSTVHLASEYGAALLVALIATMLIGALGLALVLTTGTETTISSNFGNEVEARYAAEAAFERALSDLGATPDWNLVLSGIVTSPFIDGPSGEGRTLADGRILHLTEATNQLNCGKSTTCSQEEMEARSQGRYWGTNNARWQLYAHGPLAALAGAPGHPKLDSSAYVVVWVADDQMENDGDPLVDGEAPLSRGARVVAVRAEAFGVAGSRKAIEATVRQVKAPPDSSAPPTGGEIGPDAGSLEPAGGGMAAMSGVSVLSWREVP